MIKSPLLIYLHGFNSSPNSEKAVLTDQYIKQHQLDIEFWAPKLPNSPKQIKELLLDRLNSEKTARSIYIFGSSLGGYIGTWLFSIIGYQHPHLPLTSLVLINPAVRPYELFSDYLGPQYNEYTGEHWKVTEDYIEQIKQFEVEPLLQQDRVLLMLQKDDEVLDYRKALRKYDQANLILQEGGKHSFENYSEVLPEVFEFLCGLYR